MQQLTAGSASSIAQFMQIVETQKATLREKEEENARLRAELRTEMGGLRLTLLRVGGGIMVGLGETKEEVFQTMDDLVAHGCDILTIGQYLQPTKMHLEVAEFVHPDVFAEYKEAGLAKGLLYVESGPLVRSSYHAERHIF